MQEDGRVDIVIVEEEAAKVAIVFLVVVAVEVKVLVVEVISVTKVCDNDCF